MCLLFFNLFSGEVIFYSSMTFSHQIVFQLTQINSYLSFNLYILCVLLHCQIPGFCVGGTGSTFIESKVNCDIIVGYKSVYRMCFAMACFFFLFSVIMIRVRSSKDPRAAIQNGFVLCLTVVVPQSCMLKASCTLVVKHMNCTLKTIYTVTNHTCFVHTAVHT